MKKHRHGSPIGGSALGALMQEAEAMTLAAHGTVVTYSRKVFVPLTQLCRDVAIIAPLAQPPSRLTKPFMELDEVIAIAPAGEAVGCREVLFTLEISRRRPATPRVNGSTIGLCDDIGLWRRRRRRCWNRPACCRI